MTKAERIRFEQIKRDWEEHEFYEKNRKEVEEKGEGIPYFVRHGMISFTNEMPFLIALIENLISARETTGKGK